MPEIIITTAATDGHCTEVLHEWIRTDEIETEEVGSRLVERIGWALSDADEIEHQLEPSAAPRRAA